MLVKTVSRDSLGSGGLESSHQMVETSPKKTFLSPLPTCVIIAKGSDKSYSLEQIARSQIPVPSLTGTESWFIPSAARGRGGPHQPRAVGPKDPWLGAPSFPKTLRLPRLIPRLFPASCARQAGLMFMQLV